MKTVSEIEKEMQELIENNKYNDEIIPVRQKNMVRKKLIILRKCRNYLEGGPLTEHVSNQLEEAKKRLKIIEDGFKVWMREIACDSMGNCKYKNPKQKYATENNIKEVKQQIASLKYILG